MGRVSFNGWRKDNLSHIEIEGCIVNIRQGLHDSAGRKVTVISVIPDEQPGEPIWKVECVKDGGLRVYRESV